MRDDQHRFMMVLGQPPARLNAEQTAWVLNCQPHDIPVLVAARLLKPLGNPAPTGIKFFCTAEVLEQAKDKSWLNKVSNAVYVHWYRHNARKKERTGAAVPGGSAATDELSSSCLRN